MELNALHARSQFALSTNLNFADVMPRCCRRTCKSPAIYAHYLYAYIDTSNQHALCCCAFPNAGMKRGQQAQHCSMSQPRVKGWTAQCNFGHSGKDRNSAHVTVNCTWTATISGTGPQPNTAISGHEPKLKPVCFSASCSAS